jgi:anaerobic selenocysteine-containing dehydrogenase
MVSVDIYLNETTRHADVILPGLSPLEQSHFDVAFPQLSVRNWVRYSHPVFEPPRGRARGVAGALAPARRAARQGPKADVDALDALVIGLRCRLPVRSPGSPLEGRDADEILAALDNAADPIASSTSRCARARTATSSARSRTGSRSTGSPPSRTASTSARSSRGSPSCCALPAARSSSRPRC